MKKKILITGAHGDIAQSIYKIIKKNYKNKYDIEGIDILSNGPGEYIFDKVFKAPKANSNKYGKFINKIGAQYLLIIPTTENEMDYFSKNIILIKKFPILMNKPEIIKLFLNKLSTHKFLSLNNIYASKFSLPLRNIKTYQKPFFLKTIYGHGNQDYKIINSKTKFNSLNELNKNQWIAQEYFNKKYDEYTCSIIKIENFIYTIILKRKLLKGLTYYAETVKNKNIDIALRNIANKVKLEGSINIQLKILKKRIGIFEINPRLSSTVLMRDMLGFKDCIWWIEYFLNKKTPSNVKIKNKKILKKYKEVFVN
jgi:carbamoyl-phosphate synthase large subunit